MKRIIKVILRKAGWELRRVGTTATMGHGLQWLSAHGFHIKTVLDVGASDGRWSRECMAFFPDARYILYEPQPVHGDALDSFAQSCTAPVVSIRKAVGAREGHTFFDASDPLGGALASSERDHTIKVEVTTIDSSISALAVEGPCLLKLDTHGFEKGILEGASKTLEKTAALVIEAYNYRITAEALLFWELCEFLSGKGFRPIDLVDVMHRQRDDSLWQVDIFFIRSSWEGFNYTSYK
jgi:FkbM family methyltransferase